MYTCFRNLKLEFHREAFILSRITKKIPTYLEILSASLWRIYKEINVV